MPVTYLKVEKRLKELGFLPFTKTGTHKKYKDKQGNNVIIPVHRGEQLSKGLIWQINRNLKSWGYTPLNLCKFY